MSELTRFRDHCRAMAVAEHRSECQWPSLGAVETFNGQQARFERLFDEPAGSRRRVVHCPGCVSAEDRALWARLAAEVDEYEGMQMALFGEDA